MQMGLSETSAEDIINTLDEENLKLIIKILGEEREANKIAKNIIKARALKKIKTVNLHHEGFEPSTFGFEIRHSIQLN